MFFFSEGIAVWGSCSSSLLDDLESIHIRATRVIHNIPKRVKKHDILSYVTWQSLKYFYTKRLLILAHSAFYGSGIPEINSLIEKEHTNYNLRNSLRLIVDRPKTENGRKSFQNRAAIAWNSTPDKVKANQSVIKFKTELKSIKESVQSITYEKKHCCLSTSSRKSDYTYF